MTTHTTTFVIHVEDQPGVLNRIASVVRRRGFNIDSVSVGRSDVPGISRMTLVIDAADPAALRLEAHLMKLVQVRRVENVTSVPSVCRDLALIKVAADATTRSEIVQLADVFRARVVDVAPDSLIVEITGTEDKVEGLLEMLRPYGVLEMARTGRVTMSRGSATAPDQLPTSNVQLPSRADRELGVRDDRTGFGGPPFTPLRRTDRLGSWELEVGS